MKTKQFLMTLLLGIFCLSLSTASHAQTQRRANEAEVTFSVDIDCPNCQKKVEAKLPFERGVKDMKVDLEKQEIWILYQTDRTDKKKLADAIKKTLDKEAKEKTSDQK